MGQCGETSQRLCGRFKARPLHHLHAAAEQDKRTDSRFEGAKMTQKITRRDMCVRSEIHARVPRRKLEVAVTINVSRLTAPITIRVMAAVGAERKSVTKAGTGPSGWSFDGQIGCATIPADRANLPLLRARGAFPQPARQDTSLQHF